MSSANPAQNSPELLLDGLNIAWWCGSPPSLRLPLSLWLGLSGQGRRATVVFDASTPYQLPAAERDIYAAWLADGTGIVQVASGQSADAWLLQAALQGGGAVISRDRFREYRRACRSVVRNPARRLDGFVAEDRIQVPALGQVVPLHPDAMQAWAQFRQHRGA